MMIVTSGEHNWNAFVNGREDILQIGVVLGHSARLTAVEAVAVADNEALDGAGLFQAYKFIVDRKEVGR
jgi:hypothetical protein